MGYKIDEIIFELLRECSDIISANTCFCDCIAMMEDNNQTIQRMHELIKRMSLDEELIKKITPESDKIIWEDKLVNYFIKYGQIEWGIKFLDAINMEDPRKKERSLYRLRIPCDEIHT